MVGSAIVRNLKNKGQLCKEMVISDLNEAKQNAFLRANGFKLNGIAK